MRIFALPSSPVLISSLASGINAAKLLAIAMLALPPLTATASAPLPTVNHPGWQEQCGGCHMLYHPGLLPARSWQQIMDGLKRHFGRNVGMDAALRADITAFLTTNAADRSNSNLSRDIVKSLSASDRPTRISTTRWFGATHANIRKVDHLNQCFICHLNAQSGDFVVMH